MLNNSITNHTHESTWQNCAIHPTIQSVKQPHQTNSKVHFVIGRGKAGGSILGMQQQQHLPCKQAIMTSRASERIPWRHLAIGSGCDRGGSDMCCSGDNWHRCDRNQSQSVLVMVHPRGGGGGEARPEWSSLAIDAAFDVRPRRCKWSMWLHRYWAQVWVWQWWWSVGGWGGDWSVAVVGCNEDILMCQPRGCQLFDEDDWPPFVPMKMVKRCCNDTMFAWLVNILCTRFDSCTTPQSQLWLHVM